MKYYILLIILCCINTSVAISQATLVGYYPFNGNAKDYSSRNHNGVVNSCTLVCDRFGNENSAYFFNGQSFITIENHDDFLFNSTDSMSVAAWVKFSTEQPDFAGIVVKGPAGTNRPGFQLVIHSRYLPAAEVTIPDDSFVRLIGHQDLYKCRWHFIVATVSTKQSMINLFVDGVLVGSTSYPNIDISYKMILPSLLEKTVTL